MKPSLAGPAMLLVIIGGYALIRSFGSEDSPSRKFRDLELAGADDAHTGSCYSLDTVLVANGLFNNAARSWTAPRENAWTLALQEVVQTYGGPEHRFQKFTFEQVGEQARLVRVEASKDLPTGLTENIDRLLEAPNERGSTPVERCAEGASGYGFKRAAKRER